MTELRQSEVRTKTHCMSGRRFALRITQQSSQDNLASCAGRRQRAWLRCVDQFTCEMQRVKVRPAAQGRNLGRMLIEVIVAEAKLVGCSRICLEIHLSPKQALKRCKSMGSKRAQRVNFNPVPGTKFPALACSFAWSGFRLRSACTRRLPQPADSSPTTPQPCFGPMPFS